jgi:hypothetical protein
MVRKDTFFFLFLLDDAHYAVNLWSNGSESRSPARPLFDTSENAREKWASKLMQNRSVACGLPFYLLHFILFSIVKLIDSFNQRGWYRRDFSFWIWI